MNLTYKQICAYRGKVYKKAHSPWLRIGGGFRGFLNILKRPIILFGLLLGLIFVGFGIFRGGVYTTEFIFGGFGVSFVSVLSPIMGFSSALLIGLGVYLLAPITEFIFSIIQFGFTSEDAAFLVSITPILAMLIALFGLSVFLQYKIRQRPTYTAINKDGNVHISDLLLYDLAPISSFPYLIRLKIAAAPGASARQLASVHAAMSKFCDGLEIILAGTLISESQGYAACYIYAPSATAESTVRTRAEKFGLPVSVSGSQDENWTCFKKELALSEYDMYEMYNRNVYQALTKNRVDTAQNKTLLYVLSFNDRTSAQLCADAAQRDGYILTENGSDTIHEATAKDLRHYMIILEQQSKLGLERLNINCHNIIDLAHRFNGRLQNWSIKNY